MTWGSRHGTRVLTHPQMIRQDPVAMIVASAAAAATRDVPPPPQDRHPVGSPRWEF